MALRMFYVDESYDDDKFVLTGISIRHSHRRQCFQMIKAHRRRLKDDFGIKLSGEIHAYKLVRGKGRSFSTKMLSKRDRALVFHSQLSLISRLPSVHVFNVCLDVRGRNDPQRDAWDRLLNRIQKYCTASSQAEASERSRLLKLYSGFTAPLGQHGRLATRLLDYHPKALIFADQGRENEIRSTLRKMTVYNPIPSKFGQWDSGESQKSIVTDSILEDVVFKDSAKSYLIQLVDCAAYALLKREVAPTPVIQEYGIHLMWDQTIRNVCHTQACKSDECGIVRK